MWICPKCKREFAKTNQSHSCASYPLENHISGKGVKSKSLFDALIKSIENNIGPVKIESLHCCIHLVSNYTFSGVWISKDKIKLDFRITNKIEDPRISQMVKMSANRYLYYLEISDENEIDDKLISWLRDSYFLNH